MRRNEGPGFCRWRGGGEAGERSVTIIKEGSPRRRGARCAAASAISVAPVLLARWPALAVVHVRDAGHGDWWVRRLDTPWAKPAATKAPSAGVDPIIAAEAAISNPALSIPRFSSIL